MHKPSFDLSDRGGRHCMRSRGCRIKPDVIILEQYGVLEVQGNLQSVKQDRRDDLSKYRGTDMTGESYFL
jgi:hypothetical protein